MDIVSKNCEALLTNEQPVLFHFGQNDIAFVFHFKRAQAAQKVFSVEDFENFISESIDRYMDFLRRVRAHLGPPTPIVVSAVMPPALADDFLFKNDVTTVTWPG